MPSLTEILLDLEKKLLDPALRRTPEKLASLLADDFVEFGSSGRSLDKKRILYLLRKQAPLRLTIDCLLYTSPSPRDLSTSRMPSSA